MEKINFTKLYEGKCLRISFVNDKNHERVVTGYIIFDDDKFIIIKTIKDETVTIRKDLLGNILQVELDKNGQRYN